MTAYEQGFLTKCAECGLGVGQSIGLMKIAARAKFDKLSYKEMKRILETMYYKNIFDKNPGESRFIATRLRSNTPGGKRMRALGRKGNDKVRDVATRQREFDVRSSFHTGDPSHPMTLFDAIKNFGYGEMSPEEVMSKKLKGFTPSKRSLRNMMAGVLERANS